MVGRSRTPTRKNYIESSHYQKEQVASAHSRRVSYVVMLAVIWLAPVVVVCLWHTIVNLDGSALEMWELWKAIRFDGVPNTNVDRVRRSWRNMWRFWNATRVAGVRTTSFEGIRRIWPMPSFYACKLIFTFAIFEALLQIYVPGERHIGIVSPTGNRPVYKKNGFSCCIITLFVYYFAYKENYFAPAEVYDHLGEIYSALIIIAFITCNLIFLKGYTYPSSTDWGSTGNVLVDFYWGLELYPRLGKDFDIKLFFNSRFGMMGWCCLVISFLIKQWELRGQISDSLAVTAILQLVYLLKFFWWEGGYLNTLNMMHDRAGFYTIWGSMVWIPSVYSSPALYLVNHPVQLGKFIALYILLGGFICIYAQYNIDHQRQEFRETHGKAKVWGIFSTKIQAHYVTEKGEHKQTLLLASGWWGLARHIHYAFEIGAYFFWTVPSLFTHVTPYFSLFFVMLLLIDRVERDDKRCKAKYMKFWDQYKKKVPNKIVPLIY